MSQLVDKNGGAREQGSKRAGEDRFSLARLRARTLAPIIFWMLMQIPAYGILELLFRLERPFDPTYVHFDVQIYFNAAKNILAGQVPYRDFFFPYPPFSILFFVPPNLLSANAPGYQLWFKLESLILIWLGLLLVAFVARRIGQPLHRTLLCYTLSIPAIGSILWQRYDLMPAFLVLLALAAWMRGWHVAAWAILALGTLTKIYPALLVPLFAIAEWRTGRKKELVIGILGFGILIAIGMLPFLLASFEETTSTFFSQTGRGFEVESVGASLLMAGRWLGISAESTYKRRLNTWEVSSPYSEPLQFIMLILQAAIVIFVYVRFWRTSALVGQVANLTYRFSAALIALALLTSKVFSAQFIVWLFPIAFLGGERKFVASALLFVFAALMTQGVFPFLWQPLKEMSPLAVGMLLARDAALVALAVISLRDEKYHLPITS